jgi:hypothetical protein
VWGLQEELLAGLIEMTDLAGWRSVAPYLKKGFQPKITHVPRPHEGQRTEKRQVTPEDMVELFGPPVI